MQRKVVIQSLHRRVTPVPTDPRHELPWNSSDKLGRHGVNGLDIVLLIVRDDLFQPLKCLNYKHFQTLIRTVSFVRHSYCDRKEDVVMYDRYGNRFRLWDLENLKSSYKCVRMSRRSEDTTMIRRKLTRLPKLRNSPSAGFELSRKDRPSGEPYTGLPFDRRSDCTKVDQRSEGRKRRQKRSLFRLRNFYWENQV